MSIIDRKGIFFCVIGPAGSGKTTITQKLRKEFANELALSVSMTSRAPRSGEIDGTHYHFVSREIFQEKVRNGAFFEWEETHGNLYGTLKETLETVVNSPKDLLLDIDIKGALNFKKQYPLNTTIIFLLPPSQEELKKRILARSALPPEDLSLRLETAKKEYRLFLEDTKKEKLIEYAVINDSLDLSYQSIRAILLAERASLKRIAENSLKMLLGMEIG